MSLGKNAARAASHIGIGGAQHASAWAMSGRRANSSPGWRKGRAERRQLRQRLGGRGKALRRRTSTASAVSAAPRCASKLARAASCVASNCVCWAMSSCEAAPTLLAFQRGMARAAAILVVWPQRSSSQAQPKIATGDVGFQQQPGAGGGVFAGLGAGFERLPAASRP